MDSLKKGRELLYRVSLNPDFQTDVVELRIKYDLPLNGFPIEEEKEIDGWAQKNFPDEIRKFKKDCTLLLKKYKLPDSLEWRLNDYIIYDSLQFFPEGIEEQFAGAYTACAIDSPRIAKEFLQEPKWKDNKTPYTRLLIHEHASKRDVKEFIDSHWGSIRESMFPHSKVIKQKRIRITSNKERDERIFDLWKQIRNKKIKRIGTHIDMQISGIMRVKYEVNLSEGNIRKIIQRQRKLHNL